MVLQNLELEVDLDAFHEGIVDIELLARPFIGVQGLDEEAILTADVRECLPNVVPSLCRPGNGSGKRP
jgi:hypothetical protein